MTAADLTTARVIVERFRAGDTVRVLAWDYHTDGASIEAVIRWALSGGRHDAPALEYKQHRGGRRQ